MGRSQLSLPPSGLDALVEAPAATGTLPGCTLLSKVHLTSINITQHTHSFICVGGSRKGGGVSRLQQVRRKFQRLFYNQTTIT